MTFTQTLDVRGITTMDSDDALAIYRTYREMAFPTLCRQKILVMRKLGQSERRLTDNRAADSPDDFIEIHCCANIEITLDVITLLDAALAQVRNAEIRKRVIAKIKEINHA